MPLERLLQVHVAALVAMGALLLGMEQQSTILPLLAVVSALISVFLTDFWRMIRLNTTVANIAGIVAVLVCLSDFFEYGHKQQQLFSVANLLVYLQLVLLFQEKNNRLYGHLLVLSLLQVVVASALGLELRFGVLLVVYMFVALAALTLFFFHRELSKYGRAVVTNSDGVELWAKPMPRLEESGLQPTATYADMARALTPVGLLKSVLIMGISAFFIASTLFFSIPRGGTRDWQSEATMSSQIAFAPEVTLNEKGLLRRSEERVMRVKFYNAQTDEPFVVAGEPYFRGTVLWDYTSKGDVGHWSQGDLGIAAEYVKIRTAPSNQLVVRQEIALAPRRDQLLFSVWPFYQEERTPKSIAYNVRKRQLVHKRDDHKPRLGDFRYCLLTPTFHSGRQDPIVGHSNHVNWQADTWELEQELKQLCQVDWEQFPELKKMADEIVAKVATKDRISHVMALESHLRNANVYHYETDFTKIQSQRQLHVDPIEDFISNHRTGHCEYFASALALMLRTQGIPSRLVVGYLGGEYNEFGKYYTVREEHAHAWVEAYLEPGDIPASYRRYEGRPQSAWLRLDPTPPGNSLASVAIGASIFARLGQWVDYTKLLWTEYVVGFNSERQHRSIYRPLASRFRSFLQTTFSRETWQHLGDRIVNLRWFNWRAGLLSAVVLLASVSLYWLAREPVRRIWQVYRTARRPIQGDDGHRIKFYDRLESLLARHGWHRPAGQTPHEFAMEVGGRLADQSRQQSVSSLPRRIVELFYRVRFGGYVLNREELVSVEQALTELDSALIASHDDCQSR